MTEKVKYNPHIELPENYKKIYERIYEPKKECSYPTKKAIKNDSFITCYEVVNELLFNIFKYSFNNVDSKHFKKKSGSSNRQESSRKPMLFFLLGQPRSKNRSKSIFLRTKRLHPQ